MRRQPGLIMLITLLLMAIASVSAQGQDATTATATPSVTSTFTSTVTSTVTSIVAVTVTVTVAPIPTLTATPTVALATGVFATVETDGPRLRVRAEPSLSAPIVARLVDGSLVNILARNVSGEWVLVPLAEADAPYGWASAAYLRLSEPVMALPVLAAAPVIPFGGDGSDFVAVEVPAPPVATMTPVIPATPPPPPAVALAAAPLPAPGLYGKLAVPVFDERRKTYNVWLVNADGSDLRLVVEQASSPALSRDGAMLAYRRWKVDDRGIVVANVDGSNPWRITEKLEDVLPSFSPDRTKVAFSTYRWGDRKSRLYYAWSDEQNRVAWEWGAGGIFGEDPYWAADGRIFFRVTRPERSSEELWSMDGRTGENRTLLHIAPSIRAPAISPDQRTVAYMAFTRGNWDLYTFDLLDRTVTRLTDDPAEDGLPAFSPNGEYIAFVSNRGGAWALWRMNADGSNVRQIVALPGPVDGRVEFEPDYLNNGWLEEQISWSW